MFRGKSKLKYYQGALMFSLISMNSLSGWEQWSGDREGTFGPASEPRVLEEVNLAIEGKTDHKPSALTVVLQVEQVEEVAKWRLDAFP